MNALNIKKEGVTPITKYTIKTKQNNKKEKADCTH